MKKAFWVFLLVVLLTGVVTAANTDISIEINLPECVLKVYAAGQFLFSAPVGIGRPGHETPTGEFTIITKIANPTWYPKDKSPVPPGPNNPLGSYWLGLSVQGYGIHGNIQPSSIGTPVSKGCIRMHNDDIETMYHLVDKGCKVKITYKTIVLTGHGDELGVRVYPDVYNYGTTNLPNFLETVKDLDNREQIFMPYVIYLMKDMKEGSFQIPWKVNLELDGKRFQNVAFRQGRTVYVDPFAIETMVEDEDQLKVLANDRTARYIPLEELEKKLQHHRIVQTDFRSFMIETTRV